VIFSRDFNDRERDRTMIRPLRRDYNGLRLQFCIWKLREIEMPMSFPPRCSLIGVVT